MDFYKFKPNTQHGLVIELDTKRIVLQHTLINTLNEHGTCKDYKFVDFGHGYLGLQDPDGDVDEVLLDSSGFYDILEEILDSMNSKGYVIPDTLLILLAKARLEA